MPKPQRKAKPGSSKNPPTSSRAVNHHSGNTNSHQAENHQGTSAHSCYPSSNFLSEQRSNLTAYPQENQHIGREGMDQLRDINPNEPDDQQIKDHALVESVAAAPLITSSLPEYSQRPVRSARHPMLNLMEEDAGNSGDIGDIEESNDEENEETVSSGDVDDVEDSEEEYADEGDNDSEDDANEGYMAESNKNPPEPHVGIESPLVENTNKKRSGSSSAAVFLDPTNTPRTVYEPFGQPHPDINATYIPNLVPNQRIIQYPDRNTGYNPYHNYRMQGGSSQPVPASASYPRRPQEMQIPSIDNQRATNAATLIPTSSTAIRGRKRKVKEEVVEPQPRPRVVSKRSRVEKTQVRRTNASFGRHYEGIESIMQSMPPMGSVGNTHNEEGPVEENIDRIRSPPHARYQRHIPVPSAEEEKKSSLQSPENWPPGPPFRYNQNNPQYITDLEAPPSLHNQFTQSPSNFIQYRDMRAVPRNEANDEGPRRMPAASQYDLQQQLYRNQYQNVQSQNWAHFYSPEDAYYSAQQVEVNSPQRTPQNVHRALSQRAGYLEPPYIPRPGSPLPLQHQQPQDGNPLIPNRLMTVNRQYLESLPRNVQVTVFQEMHNRDSQRRTHESIDDSRPRIELVGDLMDMVRNWDVQEIKSGRRLVRFIREQDLTLIRLSFHAIRPEEYEEGMCVISCIWRRETHEYCFTSVDCIFLLESVINKTFPVEEKNRVRRNLEVCKPTTISKNKEHLARFFRQIMSYDPPRPRTIEKDVKVFLWKMLDTALRKILSKYDVKETIITENNNLEETQSEHLGVEEEREEVEEHAAAEEEEENRGRTLDMSSNDRS